MKVFVQLTQEKVVDGVIVKAIYYQCRVKETSQLEAAAKVASRGFYGLMPVFIFKGNN